MGFVRDNRMVIAGVLLVALSIAVIAFSPKSVVGRPLHIIAECSVFDSGCGGSTGGTSPVYTFKCCTEGVWGGPDSVCMYRCSIGQCRDIGGAVQDCIPHDYTQEIPTSNSTSLTENKNYTDPILKNISDAVKNLSIHSRTYVNDTYECDDFADDLNKGLTGKGYNATYTQYVAYKPDGSVDYAHAIADVTLPDGRKVWIEPQTGKFVSIDFNGDGKVDANVEQDYKRGNNPTEGTRAKIYVYKNASSAVSHNAPKD